MTNFKPINIFFVLLISSISTVAQTFNIKGTTTGIEDGTWLYLKPDPNLPLDSVQIQNNKFSFSGQLAGEASNVILFTAKYTNYVFFWLENKSITINVKNGEFKKAIITGSAAQDEENLRSKLKAPNRKLQDSLTQLLTIVKDDVGKKELKEKLNAARNAEKELDMIYVKNNPNSIIAANLLSIYSSTWGKEKSSELYENLSANIKNTSYGKTIHDFIILNKDIKIGGKFADFEQLNSTGKKIKLSAIKGKYILLEFWGSWCGPCREENPNLVKTYNAYKSKGFEILGVAADNNKEQWLKAIKDDQLPWENVCDLQGDKNAAALIYGINAYPTNFLIDEKGIIIAKNLRGDALNKKLQELLP